MLAASSLTVMLAVAEGEKGDGGSGRSGELAFRVEQREIPSLLSLCCDKGEVEEAAVRVWVTMGGRDGNERWLQYTKATAMVVAVVAAEMAAPGNGVQAVSRSLLRSIEGIIDHYSRLARDMHRLTRVRLMITVMKIVRNRSKVAEMTVLLVIAI
ncbi:hypothetical protein BHE74_00044485 [Ensete ventricosum]|nr:hypothetical protein BHE74_00044485 [Ensete ventricosum]